MPHLMREFIAGPTGTVGRPSRLEIGDSLVRGNATRMPGGVGGAAP